jgi:hypothetical protein
VRVLGGRLRPVYQATFGPETVAAMKEHFFDLAIIAISAVHAERGFMDYGEDEAIVRRVARAQAKRSVIVADSSKFGRLGSIHTFGLHDVHCGDHRGHADQGLLGSVPEIQRGNHLCLTFLPHTRPSIRHGFRR